MLDLAGAVSIVETLEIEDQKTLRALLAEAVYKRIPVHKVRKSESFDSLISAGVVVTIDDPPGVAVDPSLDNVKKKLCTYLTRRNENEIYYDENAEEHSIPRGAMYSLTITTQGSKLSLGFPEDEITNLLDKYGVNRCRNI